MWGFSFAIRLSIILIKSWRLFYKVKLPLFILNRNNMQSVLDFVFNFHFLGGLIIGIVLRPYVMKVVAKIKK